MRSLLSAFSLLTVLPVPMGWLPKEGTPPGRAMAWFPLVGICIGLVLVVAAWSLCLIVPVSVVAALVLVLWVGLTGMLHLDGFCDCCDGLLVTAPAERRLEILKDSRVGAYAVVGVVLLLLCKYAILKAWLQQTPSLYPLIAMPASGRWVMVVAARGFSYARREGMGGYFRQGLGWPQLVVATLTWLAILVVVMPLLHAAGSVVASLIALIVIGKWASRRLGGGITGDVYGALNESVEVLCLLIILVLNTHFV